ncbi:MAG TPA: NADH-quinone oxidoreductase subunit B family protein [Cellulomonas sp.]|uniref:NADH-quinone oxidoreductase subunit B family protein n=1 Tax=Cellulomonas sp. TaxID=40001 RepID=UPI002E367F41|nr:NADH-quinone oxidoreductase subunit B family protein [Cellulomonas sp.]HEX5333943.1 NADH-quinone oxidoreductase subunit B family protein [Cellulomonas sp.]
MSVLRKILRTGRVAEPELPAPAGEGAAGGAPGPLAGSVQLRHIDAGSCNGCELEIGSAFGPVYDAERYGLRLVASPRHADALLVTGPVTRNMADPLRAVFEATPNPKRVVAVGDCALSCGVFAGGHGVEGAVGDIVPVDVEVPGCPPTPEALIAALRGLTGR